MFTQIINLISLKVLTSQIIDYTLLMIAFVSFYVLVNKIINIIKITNRCKALYRVKI